MGFPPREVARLPQVRDVILVIGRLSMNSTAFTSRRCRRQRRGAVAIFVALFLTILIGIVAFAVDLGHVMVVKTDLQRAADAAAHAAVLEYRTDGFALANARNVAGQYVSDNKVLKQTAAVDLNYYNADTDGDVVLGTVNFDAPRDSMVFGDTDQYNAVKVRIRRSSDLNGEVPLFFARVLGHSSMALEAEATAAIMHRVGGFKIPGSGENVPFLPITVQVDFWEEWLEAGNDDWTFNADQTISSGGDNINEVVLFPSDTGSSGNFGTLNVGVSANSTSHLSNQIRNGLSQSDLDFHGGELALNSQGELMLTGDPGLSAGIKDDLQAIAGKPVAIPLYREVSGPGNNAEFVIVKFVGVRIMAVQLNGGNKFVAVQPANLTYKGTIQAPSGVGEPSQQIYSPPVFVK